MGSKKNNQKKKVRTVLQNPLKIKWPDVGPINDEHICAQFVKCHRDLKEKGVQDRRKVGLICGLNSVSRSLERNDLRAVLVSSTISPPHLASHLIPLSISKKTPIIAISSLDQIAKQLSLGSLLALGFKQKQEAKGYEELVSSIKALSDEYNDHPVASEEMPTIPPPPLATSFPPSCSGSIKTSIPPFAKSLPPSCAASTEKVTGISKEEGSPRFAEFMDLGDSSPFPGALYPKELDDLEIEILDPNSEKQKSKEIESVINNSLVTKDKREASCQRQAIKRSKLIKPRIKQISHSSSKKKRK